MKISKYLLGLIGLVVLAASCGKDEEQVVTNPADLIVLDRNLFEIPASELSDATVIATIFDGQTVYQKEDI